MSFEDKILTCADCGAEFVFGADDQERFAQKGYSDPKRCAECRRQRKQQQGGGGGRGGGRGGGGGYGGGGGGHGGGRPPRQEYEAVCASCGVRTTVPFEPRGDRPVYCRECYRSRR